MPHYFIGLDAGSSLTKAALFTETGTEVAEAERRVSLARPHPGWCEVDPEEALKATIEVIAEVAARCPGGAEAVRAIGLSAAMVGAWVLDGEGRALRPGINWEDCRSQSIIDGMIERDPEAMSRMFRSSGSVLQQGCTLPVLAWLKANEPATMARARHVMSYKDYLRLRLTGVVATDRSEASVIPGSARTRSRSDEMIALFGLEDMAHLLPEVRDSETIAGGLTAEAARLTGLAAGLPVTIGAGDVAATVIGAGALRPGTAIAVLGTTCMVGVCHEAPTFEPPDLGLLFSLPGDIWYRAMVNVAGTLNLDWAFAALAPDLAADPGRFDAITAMVTDVPIGANGLSYLPYLSESGIIAPKVAPTARAEFAGLVPVHRRPEMFRAVYEGVAFALADLFAALAFDGDRVLLTGGGGRSGLWSQMIADVIGRSVEVPAGTQFGARGAALLAMTALGVFPDIRAASAAIPTTGTVYRPDPSRRPAYDAALARFRGHRDRLLGG